MLRKSTLGTQPDSVNVTTTQGPSRKQWHCRYGQLNFGYINKLAEGNLVTGIKYVNGDIDKECKHAQKQKCNEYLFQNKAQVKTTQTLELIHTDVRKQLNIDSIAGISTF